MLLICRREYFCWKFFCFPQKQFHSQIDELIEESVRDMIQLLVAKVQLNISLV